MTPRGVLGALFFVALCALGAWGLRARMASLGPQRGPGGAGAEPRDRPLPVTVVHAERRDVPLYLEGLGTVAALYTVTVRPQVDGRLLEVRFREGEAVHRGQVLAQLDARPFSLAASQAAAVLARDRAQLRGAQLTLARNRELRSHNLVAQQDLDSSQAAADVAAASVRADEANLASAQLTLSFATVTSPLDGVTGIRQVDPGNLVRASDPTGIVVVTQLDPISVLFNLPEDELPRINRERARGPLRVEVYSRDGQTQLGAGELALIDNQINAATATLRLKAVVPNPERALWPNQFVKVRLQLSVQRGALVLPAAAVQRGPRGTFVYVVNEEQRAVVRAVQVESLEGERVLVSQGLEGGESVVTEGQSQLTPNARVQPRSPDSAQGGGEHGGDAGAHGDGGRRGRRDAGGAP